MSQNKKIIQTYKKTTATKSVLFYWLYDDGTGNCGWQEQNTKSHVNITNSYFCDVNHNVLTSCMLAGDGSIIEVLNVDEFVKSQQKKEPIVIKRAYITSRPGFAKYCWEYSDGRGVWVSVATDKNRKYTDPFGIHEKFQEDWLTEPDADVIMAIPVDHIPENWSMLKILNR